MSISPALASLNQERFANWRGSESAPGAHPALFSFQGDVYQGFKAHTLSAADVRWAQKHIRILSGLYGVLKPLDLIEPYRLEMGTDLKIGRSKNLYEFWADTISHSIQEDLKTLKGEKPVLLNLASAEYFKAIRPKEMDASVISADFREFKNGVYKPLTLFLKQARGQMANWVIRNRIHRVEDLPGFDQEGYRFAPDLSKPEKLVFLRG